MSGSVLNASWVLLDPAPEDRIVTAAVNRDITTAGQGGVQDRTPKAKKFKSFRKSVTPWGQKDGESIKRKMP